MAGKTREPERRSGDTVQQEQAGGAAMTEAVPPVQRAKERFEGHRSATINLPFMTAVFRMPDLHAPTRKDLDSAARGAWSMMPSRKSMLFYGGLAATAVAGVIEWPVAAAIGVASAVASRGAANPAPRREVPAAAEESRMVDTAEASGTKGTVDTSRTKDTRAF
jgi:hypothetical protein